MGSIPLKVAVVLSGLVYFLISKTIFDNVYQASQVVIDEYFHLPQGMAYCKGNYSYWDPKITTLPGLYLVSALMGDFVPCTTYNLRFVNLLASLINLFLFIDILKYVYYNDKCLKVTIQALNLCFLPPLYFFAHVYYTDMMSLTFLLMFTKLALRNTHILLTFIFGVCSIMMRQTNVVWIAMVFGIKALDIFIKSSRVYGNLPPKPAGSVFINDDYDKSKLKRYFDKWDLYYAIKFHLSTCFLKFFEFLSFNEAIMLFNYILLLGGFVTFVYLNGSIVVGDKTAHQATIHLPQLLYFLVFYGVFAFPYVVSKLSSTLKLMIRKKMLVVLCGIIFFLIVHFNTQVHPYLLADNRHFTFYVWNRWYGKYEHAIYTTVPAYIFLLFSLYDNLKDHNCITFLVPYTMCLFLSLALQKLIEVRYFLIPFIILKLRFGRPSNLLVWVEFFWYAAINVASYYVFFNKEVYWKDFDYPQRIIW